MPAGATSLAGIAASEVAVVDWRDAGLRADAKRVLNLYRRSFDNDAKRIARSRSIEALQAAGCQTVIVLWGGGLDAEELVAAGFRVIAVDNGSMELTDGDRPVSIERKRRALQYAAASGGYEWRWGDVSRYVTEGDGALLDFHGPWSKDKRHAVQAARQMTAVVVTLTPSHDLSTDATSAEERQMAYQLFLKMAWADKPRWEAMTANGHVRRLTDYHEDQGRAVFVYLLARRHIRLSVMSTNDRIKTRRDKKQRRREIAARSYERNREKILAAQRTARNVSVEKACLECGAIFIAGGSSGLRSRQAKYCSPSCEKAAHYRQNRALLLRKRVAAVSGTAAEAVYKAPDTEKKAA